MGRSKAFFVGMLEVRWASYIAVGVPEASLAPVNRTCYFLGWLK